jgi:hypothetical protein
MATTSKISDEDAKKLDPAEVQTLVASTESKAEVEGQVVVQCPWCLGVGDIPIPWGFCRIVKCCFCPGHFKACNP